MEHKVLRTAEKLQKSHTKKHWLYRGLSVLAAGAVFCTTYALILPAITLDKDAICGYDEHTHTDECYTSTGSWACMDNADTYEMLANADYVAHTHTDECYNEAGEIICPFADWDNLVEPHEHTDECYAVTVHTHDENCMEMVQGALICTLPESAGHKHGEECMGEEPVLTCTLPEHEYHTDDCYDSNENIICGMENHVHNAESCYTLMPVPVCGLEESEGHTHTSTCYEYVTAPTCNIDEGTETRELICEKIALHTHTDACYTDGAPDGVLTCGQPEVILHEHADCYEAGEPELTCEIEEHTHTDECYGTYEEVPGMYNSAADSSGDLSSNAIYWLGKLPAVTGNWAYDLVEVAQSQVEYTENAYTQYIIYGDWSEQWDQTFVSWCLRKAEIDKDVIPRKNTVIDFIDAANEKGILHEGVYIAEAGDIVVYYTEDGNVLVGIVYHNEETKTYGVIGVQDGVVTNALDWNFEDIVAWVCVNELDPNQTATEEPSEDEEYLLDEDKWDPVAWQKLVDSGWFEYWQYYPELYDEETNTVQKDPATVDPTTTQASGSQIKDEGGSKKADDDKVEVSKTAKETDSENVFDITLTVTTQEDIQRITTDPDMAVVIVMDISNTMKDKLGSITKYQAACEAAENFVDQFSAATAKSSASQIGFVAFNTDAHEICEMQSVNTDAEVTSFKDGMRTKTGTILNADGYAKSHKRFTNMEAGLKMAQDMLATAKNKNKFIVFLSDGLPTTYIQSNYTGYDPYMEGTSLSDGELGYFKDRHNDLVCLHGTDYSDKAAERAQDVAVSIKSSGINIYSIGVGLDTLGTQNQIGWDYIKRLTTEVYPAGSNLSTVDRPKAKLSDSDSMYSLQIYNSDYTGGDNRYFEYWLKTKIGSDFFVNCDNESALNSAFVNVFEEIQTIVQTSMTEAWTVTDPIPTENFDYIGKVSTTNVGEFVEPGTDNTITWDLKKATAKTQEEGSTTTYTYTVTYRVRLKNELDGFTETDADGSVKNFLTNETTTLKYRYVETENEKETISKQMTIDFPIPSVHGYLGELTFKKYADRTTVGIPGAEFTLTHANDCDLCELTGETHESYWKQLVYTSTSDADGSVAFSNIPSGHTYILEETEVPVGYTKNSNTYTVTVSYDTVTVFEKDGEETKTWKNKDDYIIYNFSKPELPATGGTGTRRYILMGVLLMSTAVLLFTVRRRQRE